MSKKDAYKKMVPVYVKYMNRYVSEVLGESAEEMQKKAQAIYDGMYEKTPEIGGGDNPMADNLYGFMTLCAYYEASDHRVGKDSFPYVQKWRNEDIRILGKLVNLNNRFSVWLMEKIMNSIIKKTAKKKAKGEWGNTWTIEHNPKGYKEGVCYVLYGCPLLAFAKANGYVDMMPDLCKMDHDSARLMHGKLIRFETEATGGTCCDYWFVGDKSEMAEKYKDLPIK